LSDDNETLGARRGQPLEHDCVDEGENRRHKLAPTSRISFCASPHRSRFNTSTAGEGASRNIAVSHSKPVKRAG
jgi:hypothetical protein